VAPEVPAEVAGLARRMLARRRDHRPFDLNEIAQVLARYTRFVAPPFGPPQIPGVVRRSGDDPAPNADETLKRLGVTDSHIDVPPDQPRARMGRLTTIGLGVLVVSVLVGESFLLWRGRSNQPVAVPITGAAALDAGRARLLPAGEPERHAP
jgi:hypothetical protein